MEINSIKQGVVIDHIKAGNGMKVIQYLDINTNENTVAFIMNAPSKKYGRKDLIKLENVTVTDDDLAALGLIDHHATVSYIEDEKIARKVHLRLPLRVKGVIKCRNPRCVTSIEPGLTHIFHLVDENTGEYRCEYCDDLAKTEELWS